MNVLVVGLGTIGRRHARNLRSLLPESEIIAVRRPEATAEPDLVDHTVHSIEQALQFSPRLAIVAGPASHHLEISGQLLRAGLDVFVEKPLSAGLQGCQELVRLCQQRGRILMVGYNLRFHPGPLAVHQSLQNGLLGELISARFEVGQYLPDWRPTSYTESVSVQSALGGGVLLELSHEIDLCRWLLGDSLETLADLRCSGTLETEVEDQADILLRLRSGQTVSIHLDMIDRGSFRGCRLQGTEASLCWDHSQRSVQLRGSGGHVRQVCTYANWEPNQCYLDELKHFLDCVGTRKSPIIGPEDGMAVMKLVETIRESNRVGSWLRVG